MTERLMLAHKVVANEACLLETVFNSLPACSLAKPVSVSLGGLPLPSKT